MRLHSHAAITLENKARFSSFFYLLFLTCMFSVDSKNNEKNLVKNYIMTLGQIEKQLIGPTETRTRIAGFRVQSANHYTIGPAVLPRLSIMS